MDNTFGFLMTSDVAEQFFKRCIEREAITKEERIEVLNELVKELKAIRLTKENVKRQVKGKKILVVKKDKRNENKI